MSLYFSVNKCPKSLSWQHIEQFFKNLYSVTSLQAAVTTVAPSVSSNPHLQVDGTLSQHIYKQDILEMYVSAKQEEDWDHSLLQINYSSDLYSPMIR